MQGVWGIYSMHLQAILWFYPTFLLDDRAIGVFPVASGAHPASSPMGTGGPFPGGKAQPGRDADHSPQSSAEVVNE
jgi:hypothetical protein